MSLSLGNRKKIRGWKTQLKRVERWRQHHLTPNWSHLETYGVDYVKVQHLDPWGRLSRREPPVWLRRLILSALLDIHEAWARATQGRADLPYLAIWLGWPAFTDSQVVLAKDWRAAGYEHMFNLAEQKALPHDLGPQMHTRLHRLTWQTGLNEFALEEADVLEKPSVLKRPHHVHQQRGGEKLYFIQRGLVWIGRARDQENP